MDPSSLLQLSAPELLAPPDPPVTPAIDTSSTSTADSTSSGSSSDSNSLGASLTPERTAAVQLLGGSASTKVNPYENAQAEAAAALVDIGGASGITVAEYETSVPPNLAAASALLSELTANQNGNSGLLSAAYLALSSDDTLALTAA